MWVLDGVRVGMSSRALGKIDQEGDSEVGHVTEMKLVAIDCVADPSYSDAFVVDFGILLHFCFDKIFHDSAICMN